MAKDSVPEPLSEDQLIDALASVPGWSGDHDRISRAFRFGTFAEAFGFMAECAIHAEKLNHHPEWSNVYNRVDVELTTHDAGGVSALDFDLATKMNEIAARRTED